MTEDDIIYALLAELGEALNAKQWKQARQIWAQLEPYHTRLIAAYPPVAHLDTVLHNEQAMIYEHSKSVH